MANDAAQALTRLQVVLRGHCGVPRLWRELEMLQLGNPDLAELSRQEVRHTDFKPPPGHPNSWER